MQTPLFVLYCLILVSGMINTALLVTILVLLCLGNEIDCKLDLPRCKKIETMEDIESQLAIRRIDRPFTQTKTHESLDSLTGRKFLKPLSSFLSSQG